MEKFAVEHEFECEFKPSCLEISQDGKFLAVGSYRWDDKLQIFNLESRQVVQTIENVRTSHNFSKGKDASILIKIPPRFALVGDDLFLLHRWNSDVILHKFQGNKF